MAKKKNADLRPLRDNKRRKSPSEGTAWIKRFTTQEDKDADKPKRKKGQKESARRLTSADA
ncbi:hypothetical protein [Bhargavaea beijingensis]|uniref:hypothetical protein n=1 Tax=Bhargavaea beijingensis TaxID=426756 RepID=UPI00222467A7|nr:hypothetical protein [Bhargavaea beijingensis]MCW1926955.1 hypothetical protein [Bhargavaea beijingensis]